MGLGRYRLKRDFRRTPEPPGRVHGGEGFSFVIQKHHARRLHYDLRLELGGVLKSWAVPKGPSLDPREKRLAVHVEDHPMEYGGFEGVIPEGEYGAGRVLVWDQGRWCPEGDPEEGYRAGRLKFRLEGVKLHGRWSLVEMRSQEAASPGKNWLLIKERDEFASTGDITTERPESVLAESGPPRVWEPHPAPGGQRGRRPRVHPVPGLRDEIPAILEPELAILSDRAPEGPAWIHEVKFDGYRVFCRIEGPQVRLTTRHGKDWTESFPSLCQAARQIPARQALLDGEVVVLDEKGVSRLQSLQNALGQGRERDILYYVFDLLYLDGRDLRRVPLLERKKVLAGILKGAPGAIRLTDHVEGKGPTFFKHACELGLEGIVSKRRDSPYRSGRTPDWLKTKCLNRQEFVIGGYTDPEGSRSGFGALLLGLHDPGGGLFYAGRVGTGFTEDTLGRLRARLLILASDKTPFEKPLAGAAARGVHWLKPRLVAEVAFSGWTDEGILREARYLGLREDKPSAEVILEKPEKPVRADSHQVAGISLTHPDRILYPEVGITKRDLAHYYESIADWILPYLVGRPLTLVRCPEGRGKECFYQKHAHAGTPGIVRRVRVPEGTGTGPGIGTYLFIDGLPGLVALVQMGVLELHPWASKVETLERPDQMTIDLDPSPEVPWKNVVEAAIATRQRLEDLGLESFVKTTGGKGLHVVVPLLPRETWDGVREFSRAIAEEFVRTAPDRFVATMTKSKREGKIFLDFFRNTRGATAVAAYSTRARPGATVSTPLSWEELPKVTDAGAFSVATIPGRLKRRRTDPWRGFFETRQSITAAMRQAVGIKEGRSA